MTEAKKKKKRVTKSDSVRTEVVDVVHKLPDALLQQRVVTLTLEQATALAAAEKKTVRVTCEDDNYYVVTCEFDMSRLNVELEKGVVVRAALG